MDAVQYSVLWRGFSNRRLVVPLGLKEFANKCFETEFLNAYCVMPEPKLRLLLIALRPYLEMLDACAIITALMKRLENNFQLTVGRWKFNFRSNQHLSNKDIKQTNYQRIVFIRYWRVKKKVIVRDSFKIALNSCIVPSISIPCFFWRPFILFRY